MGDPSEEPQAEVWGQSIPGREQPGQGCKVGMVLVCLRNGKKASALQPASQAEGGDGAGGRAAAGQIGPFADGERSLGFIHSAVRNH